MIEHSEALEYLAKLPDQSIDCILTDPPYKMTRLDYEQYIDWDVFWQEVARVRKPHCPVIMFSQQPFTTTLIKSNFGVYGYEIIWHKSRKTGSFNSKWRPLQQHENILVFYPRKSTYNPQLGQGKPKGTVHRKTISKHYSKGKPNTYVNKGERQPTTMLYYPSAKRTKFTHPSEKPLDLLRYLVRTYSRPDDTILDPFAGRATTYVASILEGRFCKSCDKLQLWVDRGNERIAEYPLFASRVLASLRWPRGNGQIFDPYLILPSHHDDT